MLPAICPVPSLLTYDQYAVTMPFSVMVSSDSSRDGTTGADARLMSNSADHGDNVWLSSTSRTFLIRKYHFLPVSSPVMNQLLAISLIS